MKNKNRAMRQISAQILRIRTAEKKFPVSQNLYGIFFEDINRAGDGGLYPEMIRNRSFEDSIPPASSKLDERHYALISPQGWKDQFNNGEGLTRWILSNHLQMTEIPAWYAQEGTICLDQTDTLNRNREASLAVSGPAGEAVLCNTGFAGMAFEAGRRYHCYLFLKADRPLQLTVALSDADGTLADDTLSVPASGEDYVRIDTTLTVARSSRAETPDPGKAYHGPMSDVGIQNPAEQTGMLKLTLRATQGPVSARIGFASLMPEETYLDTDCGRISWKCSQIYIPDSCVFRAVVSWKDSLRIQYGDSGMRWGRYGRGRPISFSGITAPQTDLGFMNFCSSVKISLWSPCMSLTAV